MTYQECVEAFEDYMKASLPINAKIEEKAKKALEELKKGLDPGWISVMDGDGEMPKVDEDGYSEELLLSFENADFVCLGQYRVDEEGGAFYAGDDADPLTSIGLIVNAWAPRPKRYEGG